MPLLHLRTDVNRHIYEFGIGFIKEAKDSPQSTYGLAGRLYLSKSGWLLLHVPNALVNGAFDALNEPGIEQPTKHGVRADAHISVMSKEEVAQIGADKITERGHVFRYQLGPLKSVKPHGEGEFSKVWFIEVKSPELKKLRKSYGLSPLPYEDHEYHATIAYRRKGVLSNTDVSKTDGQEKDGATRVSRDGRHPGIQQLAGHEGALQQSESQGVQTLRGQGDQGLQKMAEFFAFLSRHGASTGGNVAGTKGLHKGVRERQLLLGHPETTSPKQTKQSSVALQGQDSTISGLGRGNRYLLGYDIDSYRSARLECSRSTNQTDDDSGAEKLGHVDMWVEDSIDDGVGEGAGYVAATNSVLATQGVDYGAGGQKISEAVKEQAKGIPDRKYYGNLEGIKPGLLEFVIQRHLAERAGPHFDLRFGDPSGLHSFATRRPLPGPGGRTALFRQPMHSYKYKDWEGTIPSGRYGAGRVKQHRAGQLLFTKMSPNAIHFTTADKKHPERFVLIKPEKWKEHNWLLINKTPTSALPYNKVRYQKIPSGDVDQFISQMQSGDSLEAKVDGASSLIKLLEHGVELTSYRQSSETGRPIVHTERFFGCFAENSRVELADGTYCPISMMKPGMSVTTPGGSATVAAVLDNGISVTNWLQVNAGDLEVTVTEQHEFFVRQVGWVPIGRLANLYAEVFNDGSIEVEAQVVQDLQKEFPRKSQASERTNLFEAMRRQMGGENTGFGAELVYAAAEANKSSEQRVSQAAKDDSISVAGGCELAEDQICDRGADSGGDRGTSRMQQSYRKSSTEEEQFSSERAYETFPAELYAGSNEKVERSKSARTFQAAKANQARTYSSKSGSVRTLSAKIEDLTDSSCSTTETGSQSQRSKFATTVYEMSRDGGRSFRPTHSGVLLIKRLPGIARRRYDLHVQCPEHWYRVEGFLVHNSGGDYGGTIDIPKEMVGSVLKGEIYGLRDSDGQGQVRGDADAEGDGSRRPSSVLSPQELGGILNSTLAKSISDQQAKKIRLRNMVYDIQSYGGKDIGLDTPRAERRAMIEKILGAIAGDSFTHEGRQYQLPKLMEQLKEQQPGEIEVDKLKWLLSEQQPSDEGRVDEADITQPLLVTQTADGRQVPIDGLHRLTKAVRQGLSKLPAYTVSREQLDKAEFPFNISEAADNPEAARALWDKIRTGQHELTGEGAILWPNAGKPMKSKLTEDVDVFYRGTYPGEGKYKNVGAGGMLYSLTADGPIAGRIGTGLSDELRHSLHTDPNQYAGRRVRIKSQEQLPSGAYRTPSFTAFHEDY